MTRVLIAAASAVVRAGLESMIGAAPGLEVVAATGALLPLETHPEADVLLVDLDRQESVPSFYRGGEPPALVLLGDGIDVGEALRAGARAVLPRAAGTEEIVAAVQAAAAGLVAVRPDGLAPLLPATHLSGEDARVEELTPREVEVLRMLAEGEGNKQIARRLGISEHTVKFHVGSILGKLNAGSRTEAVTIGIRQGVILV